MNKVIHTMIRAALAVGLACSSCAPAIAASLDTNLIVDPGFENVDLGTTEGVYGIPLLVDWVGPGYAGLHATGWPNGSLAGGGTYFYGGEHAISQEIDLSSGDTATVIATGSAEFEMNGWFSGFSAQSDYATMFVTFEDSVGNPLGSPYSIIGTPATWSLESTTALVPIGTESAVISFTQTGEGWRDGYVDNIYFDLHLAVIPLNLQVNTLNGEMTVLNNDLLSPIEFDFYEILSSGNSLDAVLWNSFDDQGLDSIGGGPTESWGEGAGSGTDVLTEAFLLGSTTIGVSDSETLGNGYDESVNAKDLIFNYGNTSTRRIYQGVVSYLDLGDMNGDNNVTLLDVPLFIQALVNRPTYDSAFPAIDADVIGDMNQNGTFDLGDITGFNALFAGPASASAQAAPEPTTLSLAVVLLLGIAIRPRRRV